MIFSIADLAKAALNWLEDSIESLVDDAMYHLTEGDRGYACSRREFDRQIDKLKPIETMPKVVAA